MVEGGMRCVKLLLFGFNLVFVLVAIVLIAVGTIVRVALNEYEAFTEGSFNFAGTLIIVAGVIIFFIAFFGCCGAYKENRMFILLFACLLFLVFIMELVGGVAGFIHKGEVEETVEKYMRESMEKNVTAGVWDKVQIKFQCCGIHSAKDWNSTKLPDSCCMSPTAGCSTGIPDSYFTKGCLDMFTTWVKDHVNYICAVGIASAFIQLFGIIFACCLSTAIKKEYEVV